MTRLIIERHCNNVVAVINAVVPIIIFQIRPKAKCEAWMLDTSSDI